MKCVRSWDGAFAKLLYEHQVDFGRRSHNYIPAVSAGREREEGRAASLFFAIVVALAIPIAAVIIMIVMLIITK